MHHHASDIGAISIYTRFEDLPAIRKDSKDGKDSFNNNAACGTDFCLTLPWYRHLARTTLDRRQRLRVYGIGQAGPDLILPMHHDLPRRPWLTLRRLSALANYYTPLFGPVIGPKSDSDSGNAAVIDPAGAQHGQMLTALVRAMAMEQPRWDVIDLHPLAVDSMTFNSILAAFRHTGMIVQRYFCCGNWYLPVNGRSYQDYFDALPSGLRHTVLRKSRKLEEAKRLHIDIIRSGAALEKAIAAYETIYRASWKPTEGFATFIPGLIRLCAAQGWLRLGIATIDEQPAAAQIWIVRNGVASIYKLAYVERFAKLSVGSILTSHMMRQVIDVDQVREVDYLTGDDAYKRDWMSHRRERWGIVAFNLRTVRGAMAALFHVAGRVVKRISRTAA
jgi:hypothetical protein